MNSEDKITLTVVIIFLIIAVFAITHITSEMDDCEHRGGKPVLLNHGQVVCLKKDVLQ